MLIISEYVYTITWLDITPVFHQLSKSLSALGSNLALIDTNIYWSCSNDASAELLTLSSNFSCKREL